MLRNKIRATSCISQCSAAEILSLALTVPFHIRAKLKPYDVFFSCDFGRQFILELRGKFIAAEKLNLVSQTSEQSICRLIIAGSMKHNSFLDHSVQCFLPVIWVQIQGKRPESKTIGNR